MGIKARNYAGENKFRLQSVMADVPSFYLADPKDLNDQQLCEAIAYFWNLKESNGALTSKQVKRGSSLSEASCVSTTLKSVNKT